MLTIPNRLIMTLIPVLMVLRALKEHKKAPVVFRKKKRFINPGGGGGGNYNQKGIKN